MAFTSTMTRTSVRMDALSQLNARDSPSNSAALKNSRSNRPAAVASSALALQRSNQSARMIRRSLISPVNAAESDQIAQLFRRVRVHIKENPIILSDVPSNNSDAKMELPVRLDSFNRKRRGSDIDLLAEELRDKLLCYDKNEEEEKS